MPCTGSHDPASAAVPPNFRIRTLERSAGVELEDDPRDLDVVAGLESFSLERGDDAHPAQPVLDVGERLVVLEVVTGDQAIDRLAGDPERAGADPLHLEAPPRG